MTRVLITGGASGLGEALARAYAARGAEVVVADLAEPGPGLPDGVGFVRLDVRSEDDWAAARDWVATHLGGLDVLVNNAGVAGGGRISTGTLADWEWIFDINLFGMVRGTRAFVDLLSESDSGSIVNVASLAGLVHPAGMASYNAVKSAVVAFSETLSHELAGHELAGHELAGHERAGGGIRVAVVCPSYFRTNLMSSARSEDPVLTAVLTQLVHDSPLTADDIAAEVLAGLDRGEELILPDEPARRAWQLKQQDPAAYRTMMREQAAKLAGLDESGPKGRERN